MKVGLFFCIIFTSLEIISEKALDPAVQTVSKKISLGNYKPHDLIPFGDVMVSKRIVCDLKRLLEAARKDGLCLKVVSGYRSYQKQKNLFNYYVKKEQNKDRSLTEIKAAERANCYSARPGHSEHQLGTTVDVLSGENNYQFSSDQKLRYVGWLENNAHKYNFNISYTKESKEYIYEPWHIRWYPHGYLPTQNSLKTRSRAASLTDLPVSSVKVVSASCN